MIYCHMLATRINFRLLKRLQNQTKPAKSKKSIDDKQNGE